MKKEFILAGILIILAFISGTLISNFILTGRVVEDLPDVESNNTLERHTWTRAICNEKNGCVDVYLGCKNGEVESINLVSGLIWHDKNWTDPRNINETDLCR